MAAVSADIPSRPVIRAWIDHAAKQLRTGAPGAFDLAFSINVMEHVGDPEAVLPRVVASLRPGGRYHFVCPNYTFPFEPHFNIPTLGTKARTWRVFERRILASPVVADPAGTWASLNWICVGSARRAGRAAGLVPVFDRGIAATFLRRALDAPTFQRRHSAAMHAAAGIVRGLRLDRMTALLPPSAHPALSCHIVRSA
ncbi:MAG: class I SAM-dependent methyltransferase [Vicinamibacterales bacterium]